MSNKYLKKITALLLTLSLVLSLSGCLTFNNAGNTPDIEQETTIAISANEDNEAFAGYVNKLFTETVTTDTLTLHTFLQNPSNYGIDDYELTLGRYDLEALDATKEITDELSRLKAFDRSTLSAKQQLTYDQLLQYLETQLEYCDLYLFDSCLSTTIGLQVQLPLIFAEYAISEEKDASDYIGILKDTDEFFANVIEYEKLRSEKGYFMEDSLVDEIIAQCETFVNSADDGYLITTFDERIDKLSGISNDKKASYKNENKSAVSEHVIKGYQILIDGLKKLKGTNKYSGGICNYPNGKKYFEYIIKDDMGWSKSIDEYDKLLDSYISTNMLQMQKILLKDSSLSDKCDNFVFKPTNPNDILADLKTKIKKDFPDGPEINYNINYITKALEDYASPAMYFTPQIDNINSNSIYINQGQTSEDSLYTTLAHEGYPGHMYQITYFANTNPDLIRYLIEPGGYIEGWATYCELLSYNYADSDTPDVNALLSLNYATILCMYAKVDIGVNYNGWTESNILEYIKNFGFTSSDIAKEMYLAMVANPGNYCKYVLGYIGFSELKNTAMNSLGDKFNLKNFHKYVLDLGPVPFDILFNRLDPWVKEQMQSE